jgi:iron complex transport system substrate-binding protein
MPRLRILAQWGILLAGAWSVFASAQPSQSVLQSVQDMDGRTHRMHVPVRRIATNGGVIEEWILMLHGERKLVASSTSNQNNAWMMKLFPGIRALPAAFSNSGSANVEALLASKPDVVLMLSGLQTQSAVEGAGIPVVVLERRNAEDIKRALLLTARLLGPNEEAVALRYGKYYDAAIHRVQRRVATLPEQKRVRVYYASSANPFATDGAQTMAANWIEQAGGVNVAAAAGLVGMNRQISYEEILKWMPEVIITSTRAAADRICGSAEWSATPAVRNHRVYVNPTGLYLWARNSTETALQTLWAAKTIHPELFKDVDMNRETVDFYRQFFNYRLTPAELNSILYPAK